MKAAALYCRTSTSDKSQDPAYQVDALAAFAQRQGYEAVVFVEEGISGASESRPVLDQVMRQLRKGQFKALAVWKLDRLGRSLPHLLQIIHECELHGVQFFSLTEGMDTATPIGKLLFNIVGALAEFERTLIAERVRAGMAYAQAHGTRSERGIGRPRTTLDFRTVLDTIPDRQHVTVTAQALRLNVGRATLYRVMAAAGYTWDSDAAGWVTERPPAENRGLA